MLLDLWLAWMRIGLLGFGGGQSIVPLVKVECVDRHHWLDEAAFLDALAFGNALPGPITVKLAARIGMDVAGIPGAIVAVFANCVPGALLMLGLGAFWARYHDTAVVRGMASGLRPAVVGLLAWSVWDLGGTGVRDVRDLLIAVAAVVALAMKVHPGIVIAVGMGVGWMVSR